MNWRPAMRVICVRVGHRWTYAGAADRDGYLEHCSRCGAVRRVRLPKDTTP